MLSVVMAGADYDSERSAATARREGGTRQAGERASEWGEGEKEKTRNTERKGLSRGGGGGRGRRGNHGARRSQLYPSSA